MVGEVSVVAPPDGGVRSDELMYYHFHNGRPATYYSRSSLDPSGQGVLTRRELYDLGNALDAIRRHFSSIYDRPAGFGALPMDVEFKRVGAEIEIVQARPFAATEL